MAIYFIASGGGHTTYAIAIAERLRELVGTSRIKFIVPSDDLLSISRVLSRVGYVELIRVTKPRKPLEGFSKFLIRSPKAMYECLKHVKEPEVVVGSGSNFIIYPMITSLIKGCRHLLSIEAVDRVYTYSKANYLVSRLLGARVILQWELQRRNYRDGMVMGPVLTRPRYRARDDGFVLVTSGTVGHRRLINALIDSGLVDVVAQVGDLDVNYVKRRRPYWTVFNYDPDLERWISRASVVITHQGVTAVEAALNYCKPVIIAFNPDLPQTSTYVDTYLLSKFIKAEFVDAGSVSATSIRELINRVKGRLISRKYPDGALRAAKMINELIRNSN